MTHSWITKRHSISPIDELMPWHDKVAATVTEHLSI